MIAQTNAEIETSSAFFIYSIVVAESNILDVRNHIYILLQSTRTFFVDFGWTLPTSRIAKPTCMKKAIAKQSKINIV
jgi:hypothetical protein